jgi:hypothetical protein
VCLAAKLLNTPQNIKKGFSPVFWQGGTMKVWTVVITIGVTLFAACNQAATPPNPTVTVPPPIPATFTIRPTKPATPTRTATATIPATATLPATATIPAVSTSTPLSVQDDLKDEWRSVFNGSQILFASCELMYDTHIKYQEGEIDITKAKSDLAIESDFFSLVYREFVKWADPSDAVAPFKEKLEQHMGTMIELWGQMNSGDVGSLEVTDPLFGTCSSLFEIQNDIFKSATDAGLSQDSADELASEIEELLNDLYDSVSGEN